MHQRHGLLMALVRGARWGLPWVCILLISVTAAYSMTVTLAPKLQAGDQPMRLAIEQVSATGSATSAGALISLRDRRVDPSPDTAGLSSDDACAGSGPMLYVGLNTWIHDPNVPCRDDAP